MISIVTINLNDATGLATCAASIASQTCADREWLVVDGGSNDGSLEVLAQYTSLVAGWVSEPDHGVYDAMNKGLALARGDYVVFMNAGDRFADPQALAAAAAALRDDPGVDLLFGGTFLALPSGRKLYRPPRCPTRGRRHGMPAYHQATVFRRNAHLACRYDPRFEVSADYGVVARMLAGGARARRLDRPLAVRHCHPDSLSERRVLQRFLDVARIQREILQQPPGLIALHLARLAVSHLAYRALQHV